MGRLSIKMPSYQYRDPLVKNKIASRSSYLKHDNLLTRKDYLLYCDGAHWTQKNQHRTWLSRRTCCEYLHTIDCIMSLSCIPLPKADGISHMPRMQLIKRISEANFTNRGKLNQHRDCGIRHYILKKSSGYIIYSQTMKWYTKFGQTKKRCTIVFFKVIRPIWRTQTKLATKPVAAMKFFRFALFLSVTRERG